MNKIFIIAKKELSGYFGNPSGYIFAGLLFLIVNWMFFNDVFVLGQAEMSPFWTVAMYLFSIFIPAITMNLIAEEKKNGTWEVLTSLPIKESQLVWGKFLGCGIYLMVIMLLSLPAIITIYLLGKPDLGVLMSGMISLLLLGLSYLAVGLFTSSLSNQAMVGFLFSTVLLILNNLLGQEIFLGRMPQIIRRVAEELSLSNRSTKIASGVVSSSDVIFYISWCLIWVNLTLISLKSKNK